MPYIPEQSHEHSISCNVCQSSNVWWSKHTGCIRQTQLQFIPSFFKQWAVKTTRTGQFIYITSLHAGLATSKTRVNERNWPIRCADLQTTSLRYHSDNSRILTCQLWDVTSTPKIFLVNKSLHSGLVQLHPGDINSNGPWIEQRNKSKLFFFDFTLLAVLLAYILLLGLSNAQFTEHRIMTWV